MNREELKILLDNNNIKPGVYNIYGLKNYNAYGLQRVVADDQTVLDRDRGKWVVYDYERGQKFNEKSFDAEDEACKYLLQWILDDPSSRLNK